MAGGPLIGRKTEMAALNGFVQGIPDGPACLVMIGEPGIGKTALWERAVEDARRTGGCVLLHRAVESEAALSFTGLADLISPVFEEASPSLPEPQRRALEVALLLAEPGDADLTDQRAVGVAALNILKAVAARKRVVLAIDDLQWLDRSTAAVLGVALRRLHAEPVGLLATVRQAPGACVPLDLDRSFSDEQLKKVMVGPLSLGDLHRLLTERLDLALTRPELARVWESAGGNPYFALELGRELVRTNTRPEAGRNLRPSQTLRDLLVRRLTSLSATTLDVLLFAASLAQPSVELVARAYGDPDRVFESLEEARRETLIGLADGRVGFSHPLLAAICYEGATPWRRRSVHRLLAEAVSDPEERARHLALSLEGPDERAASELQRAAQRAGSRGATAAGAELAELAARLTPDHNQEGGRQRRMQAAALHRLSGDLERASGILDRLLGEIPPGVERADVLYALATSMRADPPTRAALCQEALAQAAADDVRCAEILGFLGMTQVRLGQVPAGLASARAGLERAERTDDERLLAVALARVALAEFQALDVTPGLVERGMEIERRLKVPLLFHDSPRFVFGAYMQHRDRVDLARQTLEELDAAARVVGDEATRGWVTLDLIPVEWYAGRWQRAQELAGIALEFAQQTQALQYRSMLQAGRAFLEADLGLLEQARQSGVEGIRFSRLVSDEISMIGCVAALGRIELLAGDLHAAATHLRKLPDRLLSSGWLGSGDGWAANDIWVDSIETLIRLGELERAQVYLEIFEELAPRASRRWVAGAARCRGLLAAARRDFKAAFHHLDRVLSELESVGYPLDRGRTLLVLGSVRRQAGQKAPARAALEQALTVFDELGARAWSSWALAELGRISGRRAPSHDLTVTELRVATLASRGLSNAEIASTLFMGVSTVEGHLSRVYGKLGVRRAELATRLQDMPALAGGSSTPTNPAFT